MSANNELIALVDAAATATGRKARWDASNRARDAMIAAKLPAKSTLWTQLDDIDAEYQRDYYGF